MRQPGFLTRVEGCFTLRGLKRLSSPIIVVIASTLDRGCDHHFPGNGPNVADQLSGDSGHHHISMFTSMHQRSIASAESDLRIPGFLHNGRGQVFLALLQDPRGFGRVTTGMGGLDQHAPCPLVPGTGERSDSSSVAAGSFAGCQADIGHQFPGVVEALEIPQFSDNAGSVRESVA